MSSVDTRVVEMQFDNKAFGSGIKNSLNDLQNLKDKLKLNGATSGLEQVGKAAQAVDLNKIGDDAEKTGSRINAMAIFARTAIATLSYQIVRAGENMVKSLTIDPIKDGLDSYAEQINATQIIMANTKAAGTTLPQITAALANLQTYAQQTVYSFSDMTSNIGRFTAAGVKLQPATDAIKGMANVAALSGASTEQMSSAMYQMSQALSAGVIKLQDWNSLSNANMGGQNIQEALKETAKTMGDHGKAMDAAIKKQGNFRNSLTEGWLTADIYTKAMGVMGGTVDQATGKFRAYTVEELKSQGYTAKAAASLHDLSQSALESAVNIRTIPQLFQALKEEVGGAFAAVFKVLFGDINQATSLFSNIHNVAESALTGWIWNIQKLLQAWADLGGRTKLFDGLKNVWEALSSIFGAVAEAFHNIFPPTTAQSLVDITTKFDNFTKKLVPSAKTVDEIKRTFQGLFAILDIGKDIVKAAATFIGELIGHFAKGADSGVVTGFTAKVGDLIVAFDTFLKTGNVFGKFFDWLLPKVEAPVDALKRFISIIATMGKAAVGGQFLADVLDRIHQSSGQISDTGNKIAAAWDRVKIIFDAIWKAIQPILSKIGDAVKAVGGTIKDVLSGLSFGDVLGAAGIGGVLLLMKKIKDAIDKFKSAKTGSAFLGPVKEALEQLTGTLKAMEQELKAKAILEIAAAIAVLTIAVSVLSKIDAGNLLKAVTAIGVMVGMLVVAMKGLDAATKGAKGLKMDMMAAALILIAGALDILASAVKKMADLSWNDLAKGLSGTVVLLVGLSEAMKRMPDEGMTIRNAAALVILAEAIKVLVSAVKQIADMSWGDMAQGLTGVAALLTALALYSKFSDMSSIGDGAGILLMAAAIKVLASAMKDISDLSWEDIAKGLTGVAGGLLAMSGAMKLMPDEGQALKNSAGVLVIAAALKVLASAMKDMSDMSWQDIGKAAASIAGGLGIIVVALNSMKFEGNFTQSLSLLVITAALKVLASAMSDLGSMSWSDISASLVELAGALTILVVALNSMEGGLPGAAALVIGAFSIKILADAMQTMGSMSWSDIAAALVALTAGLTILAVGLYAMEGTLPGSLGLLAAAPGLYALGSAMASLGGMSWSDIAAAIVAMAGSLTVLAVGLTAMIVTLPGAAALAVAAPALSALASGLASIGSMSWSDIAAGVVALGGSLTALAVGLTAMAVSLPGATALAVAGPALGNLADAMKKIGAMSWSDIAAAGVAIGGFLVSMSAGLVAMTAGLAGAGVLAIVAPALGSFINAAKNADGIGDKVHAIAAALKDLANVNSGDLTNVSNAADKLARAIPGLNSAVASGMGGTVKSIVQAGANAAQSFADGINSNPGPAGAAGVNLVNKTRDVITGAITSVAGQVGGQANAIGLNIIQGVNAGIDKNQGQLNAKMKAMANTALQQARDALGIHSPSKAFEQIGQYVVQGFALGLAGNAAPVQSAVDQLVGGLMTKFDDAMNSNLNDISQHQNKIDNLRDQIDQNAKSIADAQAKLNEAIGAPIKKSTAKKAADRNAANAAALKSHNDAVNNAQIALRKLIDQQNGYNSAINDEQAAINGDVNENNRLAAARAALQYQLAGQQAQLNDLTAQHDDLTQSIKDQTTALDNAIKTRDDYNKSLHDQLDTEASISKDTNLTDYVTNFQQQIVDMQQFTIAIQELRKQGLNDTMYKQLLSAGPTEAMSFVQQLLSGGQSAVDQVNYLGTELDQASTDLGTQASTSLYQAGVDAAQGLLDGLNAKQADIEAQMNAIAASMVNAIKAALGIASPSKVMAELGRFTADGLAKGLNDSGDVIAQATDGLGQTAIDSMKKTIVGLGDLVSENMEVNPVIAPVLDLSGVQKGASTISDLLSAPAMAIGDVYSRASDTAAGLAANQAALMDALSPANAPAPLTFVQNNTSPKALSSAEIYRQTNNQISVAKGALTTSARPS